MTTQGLSGITVMELKPYWGPELQRQFEHSSVIIRECRSVHDLLPAVVEFSMAMIVIDLEAAISDVVTWFASEIRIRTNPIPIVVCASKDTADLEWQFREAGVTAFLPERVSGNDLARLCRRQLRSLRDAVR